MHTSAVSKVAENRSANLSYPTDGNHNSYIVCCREGQELIQFK